MENFDNKMNVFENNLQRFDDIILEKANKYDIIKINNKINKLLLTEIFDLEISKQTSANAAFESKINNIIRDFNAMNIKTDISNTKIINLIKSAIEIKDKFKTAVTINEIYEIKNILNSKAELADISQLYDVKTNKTDTENLMSAVDHLHKQMG